jgi:hypothetical protein
MTFWERVRTRVFGLGGTVERCDTPSADLPHIPDVDETIRRVQARHEDALHRLIRYEAMINLAQGDRAKRENRRER